MGFWNRVIDRVSGRDLLMSRLNESDQRIANLASELQATEQRLYEATKRKDKTGVSVGWGWQSKDMDATKHAKLRALADSAVTSHPLAKKAMALRKSFVTQEGFKVEAKYEGDAIKTRDGRTLTAEEVRDRVQSYLDEHWEINWEGRIADRVHVLNVFGELAAWMPPLNAKTGQFRINFIDSEFIDSIEADPTNMERIENVAFSQALKFRTNAVHQPGPEYKWDEKTREWVWMRKCMPVVEKCWVSGDFTGEMLYLGINTLGCKHRGLSDLTPVVDFLEVFDQLLWTETDRVKMLRSMMFQYIMKNAKDENELKKKQQELSKNPPPPGSFVVTNESIEIKEICPSLNTASSLEVIKYVFGLCAGCLDLPEHFFYSAGDVNRASAREMTDPIYAGVRDRKKSVTGLLYTEHAYALQKAAEIETSLVYGLPKQALEISVTSADPERDALDVIGQHLVSLQQGLILATNEGWISDETAGRIVRQEMGRLGLGDIDEPEADTAEEIQAETLNKLDRVRNIDGEPKNFPLSPVPESNRWNFNGTTYKGA